LAEITPEMVEQLISKAQWDEVILRIMQFYALTFKVNVNILAPSVEFVEKMKDHLTVNKDSIRSSSLLFFNFYFSKLAESELESASSFSYSTAEKIQMETLIQKCPFILKPTTYDGFDAFCGMLTFLFKNFSEQYGLVKNEQDSNDQSQYQYIEEKVKFFEKQQDILLMIKNTL
jgi:hypothetical protein